LTVTPSVVLNHPNVLSDDYCSAIVPDCIGRCTLYGNGDIGVQRQPPTFSGMAPILLFGTVASLCCATLSKKSNGRANGPCYRMQECANSSWAHVYCAFWLRGLGTTVQMLKNVCRDDKLATDLIDEAVRNPPYVHPDVSIRHVKHPAGITRDRALRRLRDQRPDLHALVMADAMSGREGITAAEWPEWCSGTRPVYGLHPVLNSGMEQTFCYAAQPLRKV
jgi:hypothetical protein